MDLNWTSPDYARFLRRLASFSRLIIFDKRGVGLSDRVPDKELPDLETRMDDVVRGDGRRRLHAGDHVR